MAAIVSIITSCGLRIEVCHRNQPYKTKLSAVQIVTFTLRVILNKQQNGVVQLSRWV